MNIFKQTQKIATLIMVSLLLFSCSNDDDNNGETSPGEEKIIRVYLQGTSSGGTDIQWGTETFCYSGNDCMTSTGMSFISTFGTSRTDMVTSREDDTAIGVKIPEIRFTSGSGRIEVVRGKYVMEEGWGQEFEDIETLFTSEEFSSGDVYSLEYGQITD